MRVGRFARGFEYPLIGAFVAMSFWPSAALAQNHDTHSLTPAHHDMTPAQKRQANELVKIVREATERFRNVKQAEGEGYGLLFGCVSGGDFGAMGLHFVNPKLAFDGELDARTPEIVLYEPTSNGRVRLTGADYLVIADAWNAKHSSPPELNGQLFHFFESPNRFGLPPFYTLHVWAWKDNPNGTFVNWNPNVSCDGFNGQR